MFGQSSRLEHKLRKLGYTAPAEVIEAREGHWLKTSGNPDLVASTQRSWTLRLRVEPSGQPAFEAEVQKMRDPDSVSAADLAAAIPGAVTLHAQPAAPAHDPVELLTKLAALHDHGVLDDEEFSAQKARILGERSSSPD